MNQDTDNRFVCLCCGLHEQLTMLALDPDSKRAGTGQRLRIAEVVER